jgi:hypothetical protein
MIRDFPLRGALLALIASLSVPSLLRAQGLDLTVNDIGLVIGNKPRVTGVRLNYRDRDLQAVKGVNATIWMPHEPITGTVDGVALGVPLTAASRVTGLAAGVFGVGAEREISGVGIGGLGLGAGSHLTGIMLGGLGVGTGGRISGVGASLVGVGAGSSMRGLMAGGIGVGTGGDLQGIALGGIGVGGGGDLRGLSVGGIGVGVGGAMRGINIAGIGAGGGHSITGLTVAGVGVGSGGDVRGITIGGVGLGAGGNVTGLNVGGVGVGAGGTLKGISIAGLGVGAPRIEGFVLSAAAGAVDAKAIVIAPLYFRIERGTLTGGSLSAVNYIKGAQHGLTIGLFNYTRELNGVQVGLINVMDGPRGRRVLPLVNAHFDP